MLKCRTLASNYENSNNQKCREKNNVWDLLSIEEQLKVIANASAALANDDAEGALNLILYDKDGYKSTAESYALKTKDSNGLPHGAIRLYLKSQMLRLTALSIGVKTQEEAVVLEARRNCFNAFRREYIAKQAEQLHITLKPTDKINTVKE